MAVHVEHRQTMLILQHEKNFMDDYIRHFAQSDTGNGTIQYSFLRFRLLSGGKCAGGHQGQGNSFRQYGFREGVSENTGKSGARGDVQRQMVVERYLSVSYPLPRIKVTSPYGYRKDPFTGKRKFHGGIDLQARGDKVLAMMAGTVVKVGQDKTSGKYVTLQHGNCMISYCHLSKILVARGTAVRPRDAVGITGSTGRSTGEHLHITCRLNGKSVDPAILFEHVRRVQQECVSALAEL